MYWIQYGINNRIYKIIIVIDSIILIEYHIDFICNLTHSISIVSSILLLFYFQIIHEINLFKRIIVTLLKLLFSQQNILLVSNSLHSAPSLQSSLFASFVFRSYTCFCHCYFAHSHYSAFKFAVLSQSPAILQHNNIICISTVLRWLEYLTITSSVTL